MARKKAKPNIRRIGGYTTRAGHVYIHGRDLESAAFVLGMAMDAVGVDTLLATGDLTVHVKMKRTRRLSAEGEKGEG